MDEDRFVTPKENPRPLGFPPERLPTATAAKPMSNEPAQKPPPPILDRFRALLKDRDDELRVSADADVPPPSADEIVRLYELLLSELTFNSKPIITDLTIIAGEQREHGEGIADAICARIIEVPVEQKLPSLYLLDSIVKNIGREYVRYFSSRLPEVSGLLHVVHFLFSCFQDMYTHYFMNQLILTYDLSFSKVFCEAYRQVHPDLYQSMRHLFGTWSAVFPNSVLRKIEAQLQFSPPINHQSSGLTPLRASESPRPTHGIHVNPKYLEARRQFEKSTVDSNIQHSRGTSSTLKIYGQKPSVGYDEYDSDHAEVTSSKVGAQRLGSTGRVGHTCFAIGANKQLPSTTARLVRPSSPSRNGPDRSLMSAVDDFAADNSPRRFVERASPSHPGFDYGPGKVIASDEETSDWQRKHTSDDKYHQFETSVAYNLSNGREHQRPRALIDAYGNDRGKGTRNDKPWNDKPLKVEHLDVNGIDSKVATKSWQNTEEEEYDWEDMSPTLIDSGRSDDFFPSSIPPRGTFRTRPGFEMLSTAPMETDFRRSNWPSQVQPSVVDSSIVAEDAAPILSSGRGPMSKISGFQDETHQILGARYPQEAWNLPQHLSQSSQPHLNAKGRGRNFQMPFGLPSSAGEKMPPFIGNHPEADTQLHRPPTFASRMGSSSLDSLNVEARATAVAASTGVWRPVNVHKSHQPPLLSVLPQQKQIRSQFNSINASHTVMNQGPNKSFLPEHQLDSFENRVLSSTKLPQSHNQLAGLIPLNQRNQPYIPPLQQQFLPSQEARENYVPTAAAPVSSHLGATPLNHGYTPQGHGAASSTVLSNPMPGVYLPIPIHNIPNSSLQSQGGAYPPLPPGPPPTSSQMIPISQNAGPNQPSGNAFSGLISSLMAQGLISLTKQAPVQDSIGLEFNADLLKVRHESAISALYADLPRQCTTCGLRFKCQEEHRSHMDWHVTKNRINKNRKQKPSRKWFVGASMWLSGAEALGTEAVPGFLPTETVVEKKDDEEMAVPADEDQNACALCGEPFDDFYSDETEEWMYKGAVYLNAPNGSTAGMDRSQLGPIVHAKCRSESSVVSPEDFGQDEGVNTEEGRERKRMRS
ncbi:hypothetical protein L1049_010692 [Liquidambar formosana]|uniref:CID domain-containing protein n=1 Tax=Liquidambar formosana TaxID=63359 RepID=A0AAP0NBY6_LIQFO